MKIMVVVRMDFHQQIPTPQKTNPYRSLLTLTELSSVFFTNLICESEVQDGIFDLSGPSMQINIVPKPELGSNA